MEQLSLKLAINRNHTKDLKNVSILVREGWDIIHFDSSEEVKGKDTKVILIRSI